MLIFIHGEDSHRLLQSRDEIIEKYQAKHASGFNLFKVDTSASSAISEVTEAVKSVSLFDEVKLILISNIFSNLQTAKELYELFEKYKILSDAKIVILATHSGTNVQAKPKELLSLLSDSKNLVRNFSGLEGAQLQSWIKKEATARGVVFASGALNRFIAVAGNDSWSRIHNLNKLTNYSFASPKLGVGGSISNADIDLLIKTDTEPNVFEFIEALGSKRKFQAFSLLSGELAFGRDPYYLLSMVIYQFRNMLIVKDFVDRNISSAQIAQKAGIHPFVIKKMISSVANFSLEDIKILYQKILDLEQGNKQGKRDLEDGLFTLALS